MASEGDLFDELLESNHKFARDVYHILAEGKKNVIFSPAILQTILLYASTGARGKTAEEIKNSLNLRKEKEEILQGIHHLLENLTNPNLKTASQIFIGPQYEVKSTYKSSVKQCLNGSFETVDFKRSANEAVEKINSWVSEKTENKISEIITPGALDKNTCLVLANAVHFKDNWKYEFSRDQTLNEPFHSTKDNFSQISTMHVRGKFKYLEEELYRVVEIPYKNEDYRFIILLPKEIDGLSKLEEKLVEIDFRKMFSNLNTQKVSIRLPKFKMEQLIDDMGAVLQKLGMKSMFDKGDADFSEIYSNPDQGEENLWVSDVCHKAVLEISEEGSEAAVLKESKPGELPETLLKFKVDHPFIFLILHRDTILFMGKRSVFISSL